MALGCIELDDGNTGIELEPDVVLSVVVDVVPGRIPSLCRLLINEEKSYWADLDSIVDEDEVVETVLFEIA